MEHASGLTYARKWKNFNFFGASDARRVTLQGLYTLAKVLRVLSVLRMSYWCCECLISVAGVLSMLQVFHLKTDNLKFLLLAFMKIASLILYSVWISIQASSVWGFKTFPGPIWTHICKNVISPKTEFVKVVKKNNYLKKKPTTVQICRLENIEHKSMKQDSYSGKYSLSASRAYQSHLQLSFVVWNAICPLFLHV